MNTLPTLSSDNEIVLRYTNGDKCGDDDGGKVSTTIYLKCPDTGVCINE